MSCPSLIEDSCKEFEDCCSHISKRTEPLLDTMGKCILAISFAGIMFLHLVYLKK